MAISIDTENYENYDNMYSKKNKTCTCENCDCENCTCTEDNPCACMTSTKGGNDNG